MASEQTGSRFRLRDHLRAHRLPLAMGTILGGIGLVLSLIQPFWAGELIQRVERAQPIVAPLLVVIGLSVAVALVSGSQQLILGRLIETSAAYWRQTFLDSFFRMPLLSRQSRSSGWYGSRLVVDPPLVGRFVGSSLIQAVMSVVLLVSSLVILFTIDAVTVLVPIALAGLSMGVSLVGARSAGARRRIVQIEAGRMSDSMTVAVDAARVLIAANADARVQSELHESIEVQRYQGIRLNALHSLIGPLTITFMQVAYASVFVVGGWRVASGAIGFPTLITFLMMFGLFQSAIQQIATIPIAFSECRAALRHFAEIETGVAVTSGEILTATTMAPQDAAVAFSDVTFSYDADRVQGVHAASFTLSRNSLSVLIGSSGGGKSTCLGLIEGFFFTESGSVSVLGQRMSPWTAKTLRDRIGYVDQESILVGQSVRSILEFGSEPGRLDEALVAVLDEVGLSPWVSERGGLDTPLDQRSFSLSGGQRQLLAIARALINEPELLLLDEPTTNLDGVSEARIRTVLRKIAASRTVVMTAHRLSTILEADWIVVLDGGAVVGQGTHEDLLEVSAYYRQLVTAQSVPSRLLRDLQATA